MSRIDLFEKIFGRMGLYGIVLGGLAGGLTLLSINLIYSINTQNTIIFEMIAWSLVIGGLTGGIFGGISGFCSGLLMGFTSIIIFRTVHAPFLYKLTMGAITFLTTSFILFRSWRIGLSLIPIEFRLTWLYALFVSVVIAVYVSQITARKYILDLTTTKKKEK